jgi:deazaflavin-dependent oxidoreductase (nitroreductase family)
MPLPQRLARLNRRVTNPLLRPAAERIPYFGVIIHKGRTSGWTYRTPVNLFTRGDRYLIALTYGRDVDWVKNVLAAGGCRVVSRGRTVHLRRPEVAPLGAEAEPIPAAIRVLLRLLGVTEVLRQEEAN